MEQLSSSFITMLPNLLRSAFWGQKLWMGTQTDFYTGVHSVCCSGAAAQQWWIGTEVPEEGVRQRFAAGGTRLCNKYFVPWGSLKPIESIYKLGSNLGNHLNRR